MRSLSIVFIVFLLLAGAYMLGRGATGFFAIEGSCCFPPDCARDYLCDAVKPIVETPTIVRSYNGFFVLLGGGLLLVALVFAALLGRNGRRKAPSDGRTP